ncbi:hypothetical protein FDUTEX481_05416 [Tolypothrix sp. PCC 7601]|nr:hypothetical protein FDUTEX481_05416 [Tolypothrix sp. PCC 7601]
MGHSKELSVPPPKIAWISPYTPTVRSFPAIYCEVKCIFQFKK